MSKKIASKTPPAGLAGAAETRTVHVALVDMRFRGRSYRHGSVLPEIGRREAAGLIAERMIFCREVPVGEQAAQASQSGPTGDVTEKPARRPSPADAALTPGKGGSETR